MSIDRSLQFGQMKYGTAQRSPVRSSFLRRKNQSWSERRDDDHAPGERVPVTPVELGDDPEVLAVDADDERREEHERRDDGQHLHHLVLVVRDLRLAVVADACEQVAREVEAVGRAQELVVRGVERDLDVVAEDLLAAVDVDRVVDHAADGVAHRRRGCDGCGGGRAEARDPGARLVGGLRLDEILELVDLVVEVVDEVEVALGDLVDQPVREHPGGVVGLRALLDGVDVARR